jgi:transcriptional regulator with XRE-family HTH domain
VASEVYPIGYTTNMVVQRSEAELSARQSQGLVERARRLSGLSRAELARRSGASRPTLAAYAAGTKSPNLATAERIVRAAGFDLDLVPRPSFRGVPVGRGRAAYVPAFLPRLPADRAVRRVRLPLHLNWSPPEREYDLSDRRQRARVYEIVLREGGPADIGDYIDGALLADLWPDLVLPAQVRGAWQPLIDAARGEPAA